MIIPFIERRPKRDPAAVAREWCDEHTRMFAEAVFPGRPQAKAKFLYRERQISKSADSDGEERRIGKLLDDLALLEGVRVTFCTPDGAAAPQVRANKLSSLQVREEVPTWLKRKRLYEAWKATWESGCCMNFRDYVRQQGLTFWEMDTLLRTPADDAADAEASRAEWKREQRERERY